jgi:Domain of unknown function (DUF4136)
MKARLLMILPGLLCVSGLVLAQSVKYDFATGVNFSKYHTYQFVALSNAYPDPLVNSQIKQAIEVALDAKGLTPAASNPDIQVGYQLSIDHERQWDAWGMGGGLRFGGNATATSSTISIGTLAIDFFDPSTKMLVWRGEGTKTLDPSSNPEKNLQRMQKAITKILKNFPPQPKKG